MDNDPRKMLQGKQMFRVWFAGCSSKEYCFFPERDVDDVPGPSILRGLEAVQACAKKTIGA